jgi:hypothetical protein
MSLRGNWLPFLSRRRFLPPSPSAGTNAGNAGAPPWLMGQDLVPRLRARRAKHCFHNRRTMSLRVSACTEK